LISEIVYKRYTLDEIKRKVIAALQHNSSGMSGNEIADKIQVNRTTAAKYLNILSTIGIISMKKIGTVNIWTLQPSISKIQDYSDFFYMQQLFMDLILQYDEIQGSKLILNLLNSDCNKLKIISEIIVPTINTINETYKRGRIGKTELISILDKVLDIIILMYFNITYPPEKIMENIYPIFIVGNEEQIITSKLWSLTFKIIGCRPFFIGNVEKQIDPFFDLDLQRFILKNWKNKNGTMIIFIYASEESSLRFLFTSVQEIKLKMNADVKIAIHGPDKLLEEISSMNPDYKIPDFKSLVTMMKELKIIY